MTEDRAPAEPRRQSGSGDSVVEAGAVTVFLLGDQSYGLAVSATREVVAVDKLIDVPRSPAPVLGLFPLRGGALALIDTPAMLGLSLETAHRKALVITRGDTPLCGITVDAVIGVVRVDSFEVTPAEPSREAADVIGFLTMSDGRMVTLLDTTAVLGRISALASI